MGRRERPGENRLFFLLSFCLSCFGPVDAFFSLSLSLVRLVRDAWAALVVARREITVNYRRTGKQPHTVRETFENVRGTATRRLFWLFRKILSESQAKKFTPTENLR